MLYEMLLVWAAGWNMTPVVAAILAAAPPTASFAHAKDKALHSARYIPLSERLRCVRLLLAAGADPNTLLGSWREKRPIHEAAFSRKPACVAALLAAGADSLALDSDGQTACHLAGDAASVRLLLEAAPQAALMRCHNGRTPVETALYRNHWQAAQCLAAEAPLQPVPELVSCLRSTIRRLDAQHTFQDGPAPFSDLLQLVPILVARLDLAPTGRDFTQHTRHRSAMVSSQLACWLPGMMEGSEAAAGRLVAFLPAKDRRWLRTLALSLGRYERSLSAQLPPPILRCLLVLAAVQHAQHVGRWRRRRERLGDVVVSVIAFAIMFWVYLCVLYFLLCVVASFFCPSFQEFRTRARRN